MQEGEANARLQGFCRLHCVMCSLCPRVCWGCAAVWMGVAAGAARDVCWQLRFTELASCTEGGGTDCGLRQAELSKKPYNRSQGSLGQQAGSAATVPLEGAAACGASSSLCPPKGMQWRAGPVLRAAVLKGDQNISAPCTEGGKGSPD